MYKTVSVPLLALILGGCVAGPDGTSSSSEVTAQSEGALVSSSSTLPGVSSSSVISSSVISSSSVSTVAVSSSVASFASSSEATIDSSCAESVSTGASAYTAGCAGCHGPMLASGITEGGAFNIPIDPAKSDFKGLALHAYIAQEMAPKVVGCDAACADNIAAFLVNASGGDWCPAGSSSSAAPLPVAFEKLPGTDIEAPITDCAVVEPRPITMLTREQLRNALTDIFAPIEFPKLDEWIADIPRKDAFAELDGLTLGRYVDVFDQVGLEVAKQFDKLGLTDCTGPRNCANGLLTFRGKMAWGRPLNSEDKQSMLTALFDPDNGSLEAGLPQVVSGLLLSSEFLYQAEQGVAANDGRVGLTGFDKAKKLSWLIWNSVPDQALVNAANNGVLDTEQGFRTQVERMLADPKAERGFADFHNAWLHLAGEVTPVVESGIKELTLMAKTAYREQEGLADLLSTPRAYVDQTLAQVYGLVSGPAVPAGDQCNTTGECREIFGDTADDCKNSASDNSVCYCGGSPCEAAPAGSKYGAAFTEVNLPERPGIITRAALLAGTSDGSPSASRRGELISSSILCVKIDEPPVEVQDMFVTLPDLKGRTHRQLMTDLTGDPATECYGCHRAMDPYGFALEHFDANGRWRDTQTENGAPLDVFIRASENAFNVDFDGATGLVAVMANVDATKGCYADHWFHYAFPSSAPEHEEAEPTTAEKCAVDDLKARFIASGGDLVSLIRDLVYNPAFHYRAL